jgi:hypothetical protein
VGQAATRRILRWLAAKRGSEVSREDIRRYALGRSRDADQTQALLDNLSKAGWLRPRSKSTGGRPSVRYEVNPKLHEVAQQWRRPAFRPFGHSAKPKKDREKDKKTKAQIEFLTKRVSFFFFFWAERPEREKRRSLLGGKAGKARKKLILISERHSSVSC